MAKTSSYETFDSGESKVIPPSEKGEFAHMDNGKSSYTSNAIDDEQGSVPEVPSVKR